MATSVPVAFGARFSRRSSSWRGDSAAFQSWIRLSGERDTA